MKLYNEDNFFAQNTSLKMITQHLQIITPGHFSMKTQHCELIYKSSHFELRLMCNLF